MGCEIKVDIKVKVAWWVRPYVWTLVTYCQITRCQLDYVKLEKIVRKGISAKLVKSFD